MADERGFWGVEIGQAGLKALRLEQVEGVSKAVATAFDYVPHAKILSQPDADPEALITAALDTFLSRNAVSGDLIGLAVPGQNALTRFIQLPPVEQGKVHQIVMYEARQQIPFPLEEVIWDYQTLGGEGGEEGGYLLDAEVGLFAMKRELVLNQLKPMTDRKVEIELIQAAPLSLYNFLCYDRLKYRAGEPFEPGDDYYVVCEMGADATTLVVTNGVKIWIRNVPIGGNHFTRALVKDMKLTFAKAEHLKCNATKSPDPKAVFQSMRPVFNDYVTEIQRSIGFFSSVNKSSKISKVLGVGNGFRLAGLQKFLQQNLQYPVERVERFESLAGEKVVSDPLFQENILGFVVPYGLAIQAMGEGKIKTTLLPPEIATARKIRRKKPWAVLAASTLLASLAVSAFGYGTVMRSVSTDRWKEGEDAAKDVVDTKTAEESKYGEVDGQDRNNQSGGRQARRQPGHARVLARSLPGDRRMPAPRHRRRARSNRPDEEEPHQAHVDHRAARGRHGHLVRRPAAAVEKLPAQGRGRHPAGRAWLRLHPGRPALPQRRRQGEIRRKHDRLRRPHPIEEPAGMDPAAAGQPRAGAGGSDRHQPRDDHPEPHGQGARPAQLHRTREN